MTERQQELVGIIRAFVKENGYAPTIREISEMMGVSLATAQKYLRELAELDQIVRRERTARGYKLKGM